jgi:hypothetical protein
MREVSMLTEKTWAEFRDSGMLWCANRILHLFGWAIVLQMSETDKISRVYPARVKYRGFSSDIESKGFQQVAKYVADNAEQLLTESKE